MLYFPNTFISNKYFLNIYYYRKIFMYNDKNMIFPIFFI